MAETIVTDQTKRMLKAERSGIAHVFTSIVPKSIGKKA
jgi:hypothetical protein